MRALTTVPTRQRRQAPAERARASRGRPGCGGPIARVVIAPPSPIGARARLEGMRRTAAQQALGVVEKATPQAANPRLEITPSADQYRQLCRDLKKLRKLGAPSHTEAIVAAVHAAAGGKLEGNGSNSRAAH